MGKGRPRSQSDAAIIEALRASGGVVTVAAQLLGCAPNTIRRQIKQNPTMAAAWQEVRDETLDLAESQLLRAIRAGDMRAIMFFLKTQGRGRGYGSTVQIGGSVEVTRPGQPTLDKEKLDEVVTALINRTGGPLSMTVQGNQ